MLDLFESSKQPDNSSDKHTEKSDDKQSENKSFNIDKSSSLTEPKIILYGSDLNKKNRKLLTKIGQEKKIRISNSLR